MPAADRFSALVEPLRLRLAASPLSESHGRSNDSPRASGPALRFGRASRKPQHNKPTPNAENPSTSAGIQWR